MLLSLVTIYEKLSDNYDLHLMYEELDSYKCIFKVIFHIQNFIPEPVKMLCFEICSEAQNQICYSLGL